jgi:UDP-N-acetyl-2-amino-2-deoxyglucuronate dehydrogenase
MRDGMTSTRKALGVGLVGTGWAAEKYVHAFTRLGVRVEAICSRSPEKAGALASRYGLHETTSTSDPRRLVENDRVDLVVVASPSHLHAEQTVLAATHGKHVIVEKPVALTAADFDRVAHTITAAGVSSATGFVQRAGLYQQRVKQCIVSGFLGDLFYVDVGYVSYQPSSSFRDRPWMRSREMAGDSFLLTGIHSVDTARWLASTEADRDCDIVEVRAVSTRTRPEPEYDDFASAQIRFENGVLGTVTSHLSSKGRFFPPVTIFGTDGTIRGDHLWAGRSGDELEGWLGLGAPHPMQEGHPALYERHVTGFLDDLFEDKPHWSSVPKTANTHHACFAIADSLRTGKPVAVGDPAGRRAV